MKKNKYNAIIAAAVCLMTLLSCKDTVPLTNRSMATEKDSLLVQTNKSYITTSIVGNAAGIAEKEQAKRDYAKNIDRKQRLEKINGVTIRQLKHDDDSLYDFIAEMGDILFAFDSFELTEEADKIIDELAAVIIDIPTRIEVIGHTDDYGTDKYNLNLSKMRAMAVGNRLRNNGITDITEIGKGESEPIANNKTAEERKKNRRVEIKMFTEE